MHGFKSKHNRASRITVAILVASSNILHLSSLRDNSAHIPEVGLNEWLELAAYHQLVVEYHASQPLKHWGLVGCCE